MNAKENKFYNQLTSLEKQYKKLKTIGGVDRKWEFLEDENLHSFGSILLAVHYGTQTDVDKVKELIIKQNRTLAINPSYMKRIKMTSAFYKIHKEKLDKLKPSKKVSV